MNRLGSGRALENRNLGCNNPIAIDVFAGGGGLSVALKRAGYIVGAAIEIEKHAVNTFKANHPEVFMFSQDIRMCSGSRTRGSSATRCHSIVSRMSAVPRFYKLNEQV